MIDFDIEFSLLVAILLTGFLLLSQRLLGTERTKSKGMKRLLNIVQTIFPVLIIVFIVRGFLFEPYRIPSGSMLPTLYIGDFILVSKSYYGIKLPVVHTEVAAMNKPQRGDVAVFRYPKNPSDDYIKRIIGLPGDRIAYRNSVLYINGKEAPQSGKKRFRDPAFLRYPGGVYSYQEKINTTEHGILLLARHRRGNNEWLVPEGQYFVMGDNRDFSNDSRSWGFVPAGNLVGKALIVWMSWDWNRGLSGLRTERAGKDIN